MVAGAAFIGVFPPAPPQHPFLPWVWGKGVGILLEKLRHDTHGCPIATLGKSCPRPGLILSSKGIFSAGEGSGAGAMAASRVPSCLCPPSIALCRRCSQRGKER